jgi:hypothetical protein
MTAQLRSVCMPSWALVGRLCVTELTEGLLIRPCEVCRCPSSIVILVIPALFFVIPALFFVIPALSRDPERTAGLCKGRQSTLDSGSSPGMTNTRTVRMFKLHRAGSIRSIV